MHTCMSSVHELQSGSVCVLECFGKLKRLVMSFSRTWKVLEEERFFKLVMEKF